ncbi:unnamed protein product [Pedinophyceae sp. YPF-701]|nr:unnamed protein product [Pedinophyceae sp. YPF-701]
MHQHTLSSSTIAVEPASLDAGPVDARMMLSGRARSHLGKILSTHASVRQFEQSFPSFKREEVIEEQDDDEDRRASIDAPEDLVKRHAELASLAQMPKRLTRSPLVRPDRRNLTPLNQATGTSPTGKAASGGNVASEPPSSVLAAQSSPDALTGVRTYDKNWDPFKNAAGLTGVLVSEASLAADDAERFSNAAKYALRLAEADPAHDPERKKASLEFAMDLAREAERYSTTVKSTLMAVAEDAPYLGPIRGRAKVAKKRSVSAADDALAARVKAAEMLERLSCNEGCEGSARGEEVRPLPRKAQSQQAPWRSPSRVGAFGARPPGTPDARAVRRAFSQRPAGAGHRRAASSMSGLPDLSQAALELPPGMLPEKKSASSKYALTPTPREAQGGVTGRFGLQRQRSTSDPVGLAASAPGYGGAAAAVRQAMARMHGGSGHMFLPAVRERGASVIQERKVHRYDDANRTDTIPRLAYTHSHDRARAARS